jgi:nucleoside recognition membrane protein YjiH
MDVLAVFFLVSFLLIFVVGPILGPDDRTGFKRPERKARAAVGSWFFGPPN